LRNGSTIAANCRVVRVSAAVLVIFTLLTGCSGQARRPAMIVGGALAIGGIALTAKATNRDCEPGAFELECPSEVLGASVLGGLVVAVGMGLLVGALLGGGDDAAPPPPAPLAPVPEPTAVTDAQTDPANPPPAMEPEPSQW
jgi:hypothetical protein